MGGALNVCAACMVHLADIGQCVGMYLVRYIPITSMSFYLYKMREDLFHLSVYLSR